LPHCGPRPSARDRSRVQFFRSPARAGVPRSEAGEGGRGHGRRGSEESAKSSGVSISSAMRGSRTTVGSVEHRLRP
jgi:hypothetical protein